MDPSENPNNYEDYRALKWQLACEALIADINVFVEKVVTPVLRAVSDVLDRIKKTVHSFSMLIRRIRGKPRMRKLIQLALYAKQKRTRKKNMYRILKILSN